MGDLPLAVAQAAGYMAYIPADWFRRAAEQLPDSLGEQARDAVAWRQVVGRLGGSALVRVAGGAFVMHRLTQAIIRDHLAPAGAVSSQESAVRMMVARHPGNGDLPDTWPSWARVLPHLLALQSGGVGDTRLRKIVGDGTWYLLRRSDFHACHDLARQIYDQCRDLLGPDHYDTLRAALYLGLALFYLDRCAEARELDEDTTDRLRRRYGDDDPRTLAGVASLAADLHKLGELQAARELNEDTVARCRRILGADHRETLTSAMGLATNLRTMGDAQAARELDEDTLARRRRVLGEDHPDTQISIRNLAADLRALGEA